MKIKEGVELGRVVADPRSRRACCDIPQGSGISDWSCTRSPGWRTSAALPMVLVKVSRCSPSANSEPSGKMAAVEPRSSFEESATVEPHRAGPRLLVVF